MLRVRPCQRTRRTVQAHVGVEAIYVMTCVSAGPCSRVGGRQSSQTSVAKRTWEGPRRVALISCTCVCMNACTHVCTHVCTRTRAHVDHQIGRDARASRRIWRSGCSCFIVSMHSVCRSIARATSTSRSSSSSRMICTAVVEMELQSWWSHVLGTRNHILTQIPKYLLIK